MADEIKSTPEEQLLRLIEGPGPEETLVPETETETKKSRFGLGTRLKNIFSAVGRGGLNLKTLNRLLVVMTIVLMGYLAWEFAATQPSYGDSPLTLRPAGEIKEIPTKEGYRYDEIVSVRNAFKPVEEKKVEPPLVVQPPLGTTRPLVEPPPLVTKLDEIINALRLKGINWEPAPAIAIIEDDNINNTHVLMQDEILKTKTTIGGRTMEVHIKIKEISRDKVVLSYENDERDLILTE